MTDPVPAMARTPRCELPLLFAGQAQKEMTVNEALLRVDCLVQPAVKGIAAAPPADTAEGDCWLIGQAPTGEWSGHADALALRHAGGWLFTAATAGMRVFNRAAHSELVFDGQWHAPPAPLLPAGGSTIDSEARVAISQLISALKDARIFPA